MQFTQGSPQKIGLSKRPASSYAEMYTQQRVPSSCQLATFTNNLRVQQGIQPIRKQIENQIRALTKQTLNTQDNKQEQKRAASERVGQLLLSTSLNTPLIKSNFGLTNEVENQQQNVKKDGTYQMQITEKDLQKKQLEESNNMQDPTCSRQNFPFSSRASIQQHEFRQFLTPEEEYCQDLKHDIAQVRETNQTSSQNYQIAILEHELYRSRQQTIYTAEQPEHLKREIMNRIEMRHREELHSLQVAWEKEKAILSRTVNLQKLRLLDNARIMLQMEGDLERIKQLACNDENYVAQKEAVKLSVSKNSHDHKSATIKRENSKNKNSSSTNSLQNMKPKDQNLKDEQIQKTQEQSQEQASPLISISSKKTSSTILSFHKRNASTAVSTPNPHHHKRFNSNASDLSTSIFPFTTAAKHIRSSKGSESHLNINKDDALVSPSKTNNPAAPALITKQLIKAIFFPSQKIVGQHLAKSKSCSSNKFSKSINTSKQMNTFSIQATQKQQKKTSLGNITSPHQASQDKVSFSKDQYSISKQISREVQTDKHGRAERSSKSITDQSMNSVKIIKQTEKKRVGQSLDIFKKFQTNLCLND